jgi:hypothetical protein
MMDKREIERIKIVYNKRKEAIPLKDILFLI